MGYLEVDGRVSGTEAWISGEDGFSGKEAWGWILKGESFLWTKQQIKIMVTIITKVIESPMYITSFGRSREEDCESCSIGTQESFSRIKLGRQMNSQVFDSSR